MPGGYPAIVRFRKLFVGRERIPGSGIQLGFEPHTCCRLVYHSGYNVAWSLYGDGSHNRGLGIVSSWGRPYGWIVIHVGGKVAVKITRILDTDELDRMAAGPDMNQIPIF
jgi:hypothetical protein